MTLDALHSIIEWFQAHSAITISIVFLTALSESLAVVGLLVPGAILMVIFGALVASGYLEFMPVFIAAVLGAITGDGLSFWLGKYYQQQLKSIWPLRRYPDLLSKGEAFFIKHGGKGILLGRFVGPIRPIIPAIAGMMNMPVQLFLVINIFSALLWAPMYLLPGILLGASLELASQLAGRFALLLVGSIIFLWLSYRIFIFLYRKITPLTDQFIFSIMNWNTKHPFLANITGSLIDPNHKAIPGLSILFLLLLLGSFFAVTLITYAMQTGPINNFNMLIFNLAESLHSPPFDWLMQWMSNLGEQETLLIIIVALTIWLSFQKQWVAIGYLYAAYLVPLIIILILGWIMPLPGPAGFPSLTSFNLPSGHTALSISVYGFVAILFAKDLSERIRLTIYISIAWLVCTIGFTRLYFASHWLTDVVAGFLLGLAWLAFLAIAYRQHHKQDILAINSKRILAAFILVLAASFPYNLPPKNIENDFEQYYVMSLTAWQDSGWQSLDTKRIDLQNKNKHPFTLQWAADKKTINKHLKEQQWLQVDDDKSRYVQWLNPLVKPHELPLLPHVHRGRYDTIRYYKILPEKDRILLIRLWSTDLLIESSTSRTNLWLGNISYVKIKDLFLIRYLYTEQNFNEPLNKIADELQGLDITTKIRHEEKMNNWDGRVLLISE